MKSIKYFALGLLSAVFVILVIACSNEEPANMQTNQSAVVPLKSGTGFAPVEVGKIVNGNAVPVYDEDALKKHLIKEGFFTSIESIDISYDKNDNNIYEATMIIIGVEKTSSERTAINADLKIVGGSLLIQDPEKTPVAYSANTCNGVNCSQCAFLRGGKNGNGKVIGCKCNAVGSPEGGASYCNHNTTSEGMWATISKVAKAIASFVSLL